MAFCWVCGAYFRRKVGRLSRRCQGTAIRGHVSRVKRGEFPDGQHLGWRFSEVLPPPPPLLWQLRRQLWAAFGGKGPAQPAVRRSLEAAGAADPGAFERSLCRSDYLGRAGLGEGALQRWAAIGVYQ